MKGRDITKLKAWAALSALGFVPVRFNGQMGYHEIGAVLPVPGTTSPMSNGRAGWVDAIVIEPASRNQWWIRDKFGKDTSTYVSGRAIVRTTVPLAALAPKAKEEFFARGFSTGHDYTNR